MKKNSGRQVEIKWEEKVQVVEVKWIDACADSGYLESGGIECGIINTEVGFLAGQSKDWIVIASESAPEKFRRFIEIPKSCVLSVRKMK